MIRRRVFRASIVLACVLDISVLSSAQGPDRRLARDEAAGERRLALVIGNNAYPKAPLRNAVADASAVSEALRQVGFDVTTLTDVSYPAIVRAVDGFAARLKPDDIALFYFSGHGIQVEGENYLVPVDFTGVDEADVKSGTYSATRAHGKIESRARIRVMILDACRDNPFKASKSTDGGLSAMIGRGSLIAFATAPGSTASDNPRGKNGLFTEQLLEVLRQPGLSSRDVFFKVRERVSAASGGKQFPWVSDGLIGDFVFRAGTPSVTNEGSLDRREELALWETAGQSKDPATLKTILNEYLRLYPAGRFAVVARARLAEVSDAAKVPASAATIKLKQGELAGASIDALVADCDAHHWAACYVASTRYGDGTGTALNAPLSASLAQRACEGGDAAGCDSAGVSYDTGRGVAKDVARATAFFQRACDGGNLSGCANWARMYRDGLGVTQDHDRAFTLFQRACDGGNRSACSDLGIAFELGRGTAIDLARAAAMYQRACEGGRLVGCSNWGVSLRDGKGVAKDEAHAVTLFQRACNGGAAAGCMHMGYFYEAGLGVTTDMVRATQFYQRACDGGHAEGCYYLARTYENGRGVTANRAKAIDLYRKSCSGGDVKGCAAVKRLGLLG